MLESTAMWFWDAPILIVHLILLTRSRDVGRLFEALLWQLSCYLCYLVYGQALPIERLRQLFRFLQQYRLYQMEKEDLAAHEVFSCAIDAAGHINSFAIELLRPRFHYVRLSRPTDGGQRPPRLDALLCFRAFKPSVSYIFLRDRLAGIDSLRKFLVLHELGHASLDNTSAQNSQMAIRACYFMFCLWVGYNLWAFGWSIAPLALICILVGLGELRAARDGVTWELLDEMNADSFALSQLPISEWNQLTDDLETCPTLMYDRSLSETQNMRRRTALMEELKLKAVRQPMPLSVVPREYLIAMLGILLVTIMRPPIIYGTTYLVPIAIILTLLLVFIPFGLAIYLGDAHVELFLDRHISWEQARNLHRMPASSFRSRISRMILGLG